MKIKELYIYYLYTNISNSNHLFEIRKITFAGRKNKKLETIFRLFI
jgi:hypothetical protein